MVMHVNDLTVDELRRLLREVVEEVVEEKIGLLIDPDAGLELHKDVAASLKDYLASERRGEAGEDVFHALGLD